MACDGRALVVADELNNDTADVTDAKEREEGSVLGEEVACPHSLAWFRMKVRQL